MVRFLISQIGFILGGLICFYFFNFELIETVGNYIMVTSAFEFGYHYKLLFNK
jgi:hypothetical protein